MPNQPNQTGSNAVCQRNYKTHNELDSTMAPSVGSDFISQQMYNNIFKILLMAVVATPHPIVQTVNTEKSANSVRELRKMKLQANQPKAPATIPNDKLRVPL